MRKERNIAGVKGARERNIAKNDRATKNEIDILLPTYFPCEI